MGGRGLCDQGPGKQVCVPVGVAGARRQICSALRRYIHTHTKDVEAKGPRAESLSGQHDAKNPFQLTHFTDLLKDPQKTKKKRKRLCACVLI